MKFIDHPLDACMTISGCLLVITAAILDFQNISIDFWLMAAGALIIIVQAFMIAWKNRTTDIRISRLHRINFMSSLTLGIGAYMMYTNSNSWVAMIILYVAIQIFLAFRWKE